MFRPWSQAADFELQGAARALREIAVDVDDAYGSALTLDMPVLFICYSFINQSKLTDLIFFVAVVNRIQTASCNFSGCCLTINRPGGSLKGPSRSSV